MSPYISDHTCLSNAVTVSACAETHQAITSRNSED